MEWAFKENCGGIGARLRLSPRGIAGTMDQLSLLRFPAWRLLPLRSHCRGDPGVRARPLIPSAAGAALGAWGCPGWLRVPSFSQIIPCFPRPWHSQHRLQPRWEIHPFQDPQHDPAPQTQQNPTLGWVIRGCPRAESSRGEPSAPGIFRFPA